MAKATRSLKFATALLAAGGTVGSGLTSVVAHADTVQVKQGDTLKSVAQVHHMTVDELAKENNLTPNSQLKLNQKLNVTDVPKTYVVKQGDTVSEIAQKYGFSTEKVLKLNNLNWNSTIIVGQKLKLTDDTHDQAIKQQANTSQQVSSTNVQGNSVSAKAVNLALQLTKENIPYTWGGNSPQTGMDCSGMVQYVYSQLGIQLPHYTVAMENYVNAKPISQVQPGDLLFWGQQGSSYHVAIYIGNGQFVAAPTFGQDVSVGNISDFPPQFAGSLR
jgi:peptidoglycan DL-endopeptidase LytE